MMSEITKIYQRGQRTFPLIYGVSLNQFKTFLGTPTDDGESFIHFSMNFSLKMKERNNKNKNNKKKRNFHFQTNFLLH